MLRFITGRKSSGKTTTCIYEIKAYLNLDNNNKAMLIVPEQYSFLYEKKLAEAGGVMGSRAEVISFGRLAHRTLEGTAFNKKTYLNTVGKSMILYNVMAKVSSKLQIFAKACSKPGFIENMAGVISELKRYTVTPDILKTASGEDSFFSRKISELALIYTEYESCLSQGFRDAEDSLTYLAELMKEKQPDQSVSVWIDGFSDFTLQEIEVIGVMLEKYNNVNVSLCCDETEELEESVFSLHRKAMNCLVSEANKRQVEIAPALYLKDTFDMKEEIKFIEQQLYTYPNKTYNEATKNIFLSVCSDTRQEITQMANKIERLVRDEGYRYRDIAVMCGNLRNVDFIIKSVFRRYKTPCFIDIREKTSNHPIALLVSGVLDLLVYGFTYETVFGYLKTGFSGISKQEVDLLENVVLASKIEGSTWWDEDKWQRHLKYGLGEENQEQKARITNIRDRFLTPVLNFKNKVSQHKSIKDMCVALYEFFTEIGVMDTLKKQIKAFEESGDATYAAEYNRVWNLLIDILGQMVLVFDGENCGVDRFKQIISAGFESQEISIIPTTADEVTIGDMSKTKINSPRVLFVVQMNEGVFPNSPGNEGLLADDERRKMAELGIVLAPDTRTRLFDDRFLTYNILASLKDKLYLSYPIADDDGKELLPSMVISRLKELFPHLSEYGFESEMSAREIITSPEALFNTATKQAIRVAEGHETEQIWSSVFNWFCNSEEWGRVFESTLKYYGYRNGSGRLNKEDIEKLYGKTVYGSATRLEQYSKCPFSYFIQYGLCAKERKKLELSAPDVGTVLHNVIELFSKKIAEKQIGWHEIIREQSLQTAEEILDSVLEQWFFKGLFGEKRYNAYRNRLYKIVSRSITTIIDHINAGQFEPCGYEVSFSEKGALKPINITLPTGYEFKLTGRIDRVDELNIGDKRFVRIIDYKSGNKNVTVEDIYNGLNLQLLVYLDAYCTDTNSQPAGMLYFRLHDPIYRANAGETDLSMMEERLAGQMQMTGLISDDPQIALAMDKNMGSKSVVIPAGLKKDGTLTDSKNKRTLTRYQFDLLRKYLSRTLKDIATGITEGNISINPCRESNNKSACEYCKFKSICKFEPGQDSNRYRSIENPERDIVWALIAEKTAENK